MLAIDGGMETQEMLKQDQGLPEMRVVIVFNNISYENNNIMYH